MLVFGVRFGVWVGGSKDQADQAHLFCVSAFLWPYSFWKLIIFFLGEKGSTSSAVEVEEICMHFA